MSDPCPPPPELAAVCRCLRCGVLMVPDQWDSFGGGWRLENGRWVMGYGTCEGCYGRSLFDVDREFAWGGYPSHDRAVEVISRHGLCGKP